MHFGTFLVPYASHRTLSGGKLEFLSFAPSQRLSIAVELPSGTDPSASQVLKLIKLDGSV